MILIYCPISSVRLHYTVKQLFGLLPGSIYEITDNKDAFLAANVARINYSNEVFEGTINIVPANLLWETTIVPQNPTVGGWAGTPTLFANNGGTLPFDIFSAVFFLLSRYEEYTDAHQRDQHGRYAAQQSMAYNNNFLHLPLINIWADKLRLLLNTMFGLELKKMPNNFVSTIDIDQIFYYRYKPLARQILGGLRQLYRGEWAALWTRKRVLLGLKKDPNDVFDWLHHQHQKNHTKTIFFFLMGDADRYDPAPVYHKKAASDIILNTSSRYLTGIHPSYHSFNNETIILEEKNRLEVLTKTQIQHSRQHFLRFSLPQTYRALINCGIKHEYSMGYADVAGYRASIAAPFTWFDLEKNEETTLTVHPFAVMDVTLKNYMKQSPKEAMETIKKLNQPVQQHGGTFMSLWHNESLSETGNWKNWREVYQLLLTFSPENGD